MKAQEKTSKFNSFKVSCVIMISVTWTSLGILKLNSLLIVAGILAILFSVFLELVLIESESSTKMTHTSKAGNKQIKSVAKKLNNPAINLINLNNQPSAA